MLSPTGQILTHDFHEPSKSFMDDQLKAHRAAIAPNQADKAFVRITPFIDFFLARLPKPTRGKPYVAKITSLLKPHIDPCRMSKTLIATVREDHDGAA